MAENGLVKFYFASGKSEVAPDGAKALIDIMAGVQAGKKAVISAYVDSTGDAAQNAEISKLRAFAVRDLLKDAGVPEDKIELKNLKTSRQALVPKPAGLKSHCYSPGAVCTTGSPAQTGLIFST